MRAARIAGLETVPVVIREVPDDKLLEIALVENIQREDLNPIEEALAYRGLLEGVGLTQESLASRIGKDRTYITNYLRLLRLPDDIQKLVQEKLLSPGHARALLGIAEPSRQRELAATIVKRSLSVRETEDLIRRSAGKALRPRAAKVAGQTTGSQHPSAWRRNSAGSWAHKLKWCKSLGKTKGFLRLHSTVCPISTE